MQQVDLKGLRIFAALILSESEVQHVKCCLSQSLSLAFTIENILKSMV